MKDTRVKISSIVQNQLPDFVQEEYPLVGEFLKEYYNSVESQGGTLDILQNIDQYLKIDQLYDSVFNRVVTIKPQSPQTYFVIPGGYVADDLVVYKNGIKLIKDVDYFATDGFSVSFVLSAVPGDVLEFSSESSSTTILKNNVDLIDSTITVESTYGFPERNGLIQIDSEIILYSDKTSTTFNNCTRGFSGITSYHSSNNPDQLVFSTSSIASHTLNTKVINLSSLFLKEFLFKIKKQFLPGFENRTFADGINQRNFLKQVKDFYRSKGTDDSYRLIFKALFGEDVSVIKPRDFLLKPSDSKYRISTQLVVESISGNAIDLENRTLYQDKNDFYSRAYGSISKVEKIVRQNKTYYVLSIDSDYNKDINVSGTLYGAFSIHPSTKIISEVKLNQYFIDVDSTLGFPSYGELTLSVDGVDYTTSYTSKNITQFFITPFPEITIPEGTDIKLNQYAYAYANDNSIIKVRVTGVLSDLSYDLIGSSMSKGDPIKTITLGYEASGVLSNNWKFNITNSYNISEIVGPIASNIAQNIFSYSIKTYDNHNFSLGDSVNLQSSSGIEQQYKVVAIDNENTISIEGPKVENLNLRYVIQRKLKKPRFSNFEFINNSAANIQNVYVKNEGNIYVAANSIPDYLDEDIQIKSTDIVFSGSFNQETLDLSSGNPNNLHGLLTGDAIVYVNSDPENNTNSLDIPSKVYYVKKIDNTKIKLSNSKSDLFKNRFITVSGTVVNNIFKRLKFESAFLGAQNYVKNISEPVNSGKNEETPVGPVGIFANGVEIYNYKSNDRVYYGGIQSVNIISGGENFDVINPPIAIIEDSLGIGASLVANVQGSLERIDVLDGGFDYIEDPVITITGGNGYGALAKPNLTPFKHNISFISDSSSGLVNLASNTIGFSTYHKFRDYENIIYLTYGSLGVGGLSTNAQYYAAVQDAYNIKIHKTFDDAVSGINTVDLTSHGSGIHAFESVVTKRKISSINVINSGFNYANKKTFCSAAGINTASDIIKIFDHGYESGEIVVYNSSDTDIGGLSNNNSYYITKLSKDEFKLSSVGIASTNKDFYYKTNQYINFVSTGSSIHSFNYPEIKVEVKGKIGISTLSGQNFEAKLQPIFRGNISNIFVKNSGVGYGSSEIINYERQPRITLGIGSGSQFSPIINNGKITEVLILNQGNSYISPPTINVLGIGSGAVLTPVINNGKIVEVKVLNGGTGFTTSGTFINAIPSGQNFKYECKIKSWAINKVQYYLDSKKVLDDDGIIDISSYTVTGSQYCHLYAPRKLRRSVFGIDYANGKKTYVPDLKLSNSREIVSNVHSPIIGWAYDGNPIYGPYGYNDPSGSGNVREMTSGYASQLSNERPNPISSSGDRIYPEGFFVEDYQFNGSGDLDQHNGRFCVTPEYPNGVYAYFATINNGPTETDGVFKNYKKPIFPYLIGNTFKSDIIEFNYTNNNQNTFDFAGEGLLRNTTPYKLTSDNSNYDFLFNPIKVKEPISRVKSSNVGSISNIGIVTGGSGYKIGDIVKFNNTNSGGSDAYAQVSYLKGKSIKTISFASTSSGSVEFYPYDSTGKFIGFCTLPHSLSNRDIISISGLSTSSNVFDGFFEVGIRSDTLTLSKSVGSSSATGIVTYFEINGSLNFPNIRENDIYKVDDEKVKVLSVDKLSSRIKVLREYDSTVGVSHTTSSILYEQTRKFTINFIDGKNQNYNLNRDIYFNPKESLSIGSSFGVGIGSTLYFSNPGAGITNIFVPTKTIYLPGHSLDTGTELTYSSNGGSPFYVSNDGATSFQLSDDQTVYVAKISDDLVGISTYKVGLGSTGSFVGIDSSIHASLLYFTNIGVGLNHSFRTNYDNILSGEIVKNTVTVSTASTHGLGNGEEIYMNSLPGITTTITVSYNDKHRRLIINPVSFNGSKVNISNNTITISNHGYYTGQKIIYSSNIPIGGLLDNEIYYIVRFDKDRIKLSSSYFNATKNIPEIIDFTSASLGTISVVNPEINIIPNQIVKFDLSDSSLSFIKDQNSYPAFDFRLYFNSGFTEEFKKTSNSSQFEVVKSGIIGSNGIITLTTKNLNFDLYYSLVPIDLLNNSSVKKEIIIDTEVANNNKLSLTKSHYSGYHTISGVGQTTFKYNILTYPESLSYTESDGSFEYYTNSKNAIGSIEDIELRSGGRNYSSIPGISSVTGSGGKGAIFDVSSTNIGSIKKVKIDDIGFEYPADTTLRPSAKLPLVLTINPLSTFKSVGVSSVGINYTLSPKLIVIDSYTNKIVNDVDLEYNINTKKVNIIKNTDGIYNSTPKIVPTNNSNGIAVNNITFNSVTKDVTIELAVNFSYGQVFPFVVGDNILVEGANIISTGSTSFKGYNSKNYNYELFTLTSVNPQYGGSGATVVYNLSNYLNVNENPGSFDAENSVATIVPQKYFPVFDPVLEKGKFIRGEKITSELSSGYVLDWNEYSEQLKLSSKDYFSTEVFVRGETSNTRGLITKINDSLAIYSIDGSSVVDLGWEDESGFLNNKFQVTSDNNYYQYFSYAIKSKVDYETWNKSIGNLNHTVGFKKFGDLVVESVDSSFTGISTSQDQGSFIGISDLISEVDLNCVNDFDLVKERVLTIDSDYFSKEITFTSVSLQDELQSIGNRVLIIDDFSSEFSNTPQTDTYSNAESFVLSTMRAKKYITYVRDKKFTGLRQMCLVSLVQDELESYMLQYGKVVTGYDLGSFDFAVVGLQGILRFYPVNYLINDYDVSVMSYGISDSITSVGNTSLGNIATLQSSRAIVPPSTTSTIVGIGASYRSSKLLVELTASDGTYFEFSELTLIHDGTNVSIAEYGRLSSANRVAYIGLDPIGTYSAYISGSTINLDFTPNAGVGTTYFANTIRVSVASTTSAVTSGSLTFNTGELKSSYTSILPSATPTETKISTYDTDHSCAYYFVVAEDTTNNRYKASEVVLVDDGSETYLLEFGTIETVSGAGIGTIGAGIGSTGTDLYFTADPNIAVDVRVYQHAMRVVDTSNSFEFYDLNNANILSRFSTYEGTLNSVKKSFNLTHRETPIFQRTIDSSNTSIVNIDNNTIRLPKHFFVSGEELVYSAGGGEKIGIATTSIVGIGSTDKVPSTVYAIKVNDLSIKLAASAENALKAIPEPLILTSVGIGSTHTFTSTKQNSKCLITIDNFIQSPIVSTSTTTTLSNLSQSNEDTISLSGITSIFGGDLLQIDDEIVKVSSVGFGSTNVLLISRGWMGTKADNHLVGSLVTKINGNYNIIDSTIHFVEAPYGNSPIGTITNRPDSRDFTGITTRSTFSGRVFLRSGIENSIEDTYKTNYIFDSLDEQFSGISTQFILKSSGSNVSGISTGSAVVLINNVFQEPQRLGTIDIVGDYNLKENAGITTISFTGNISSTAYDINTSSVPRGGVIVSVASTQGFGYQSLVSAGGTSVVSSSGTISSISIGNTGSGYRSLPKYEIITKVSSSIGVGQTIIPIDNVDGVFGKLAFSSSNTIGIGSAFIDVPIISVGSTYIMIGAASTSNQSITKDTSALISLNSPSVGLVDVGVKTSSTGLLNYQFVGFATISSGHISNNVIITNPGSGYTTSNPPIVTFDSPLNYFNIPLIYSSGYSGVGTQATIDVIVGQASSVINFEIKNLGCAYKVSDVLTVPVGGLTGIPTDPTKPFTNFELTVDQVFSDQFAGWSIGDFQVIDKIENLFNGRRKNFPIKIDGVQTSIRSLSGSNIDVQSTLLIFINDILQVPGSGYIFNGGSIITFTEPPREGDSCKIIFYKGTSSIDVIFADVLESVKIGDDVRIDSDSILLKENERLVTEIVSSDSIETNPYSDVGLTLDENLIRPIIWCRQTEDKIIDGKEVGKDRILYESLIQPTTNIIQNISVGSTEVFVQNVKIFFDDIRENTTIPYKTKILITSQDSVIGASATAIVSSAGTISSISLSNGGFGFSTSPSVTISNPVGVGSTCLVTSSISSGIVTSFAIVNPGSGYTQTRPPQVLISYPTIKSEKIEDVTYEGDFGIIVGIKTTSVGIASTGIVFDLFVPVDSYLRNTNINVGISTTGISGIKTDYYFTVFNSNIGNGVTSLDSSSSVVGVGTSCLDNVYKVASVSIAQTSVPGIGITDVSRIIVSVLNYNGLSGMGYSSFYGEYSWGKINTTVRKKPKQFTSYSSNGVTGLSTSAVVQRINPLRYVGYSTTLQ